MKKTIFFLIGFVILLMFSSINIVVAEPVDIVDNVILIDSVDDYPFVGVDNPFVYNREVLSVGHLPLIISFSNAVSVSIVNRNSFFSSYVSKNIGFDDVIYEYRILQPYVVVNKEPVYGVKVVSYKENGSLFFNNETIVTGYNIVGTTHYRWVNILDLTSLVIPKNGFLVVDVVGHFTADIKSRSLDVVPVFDFNGYKIDFPSYGWWSSNWQYRKLITFNSSQISNSVTNVPVFLNISDSDLNAHAQADGGDIAFIRYSDNITQLKHEIEYYNAGTFYCWINLSDMSKNKVWMYYGNAAAVNQWDKAGTWNSSAFIHVWHLGNDSLLDSVGSDKGYNTGSTSVKGMSGYGRMFDGNDLISFKDMTLPCNSVLAYGSMEFWVYFNNTDDEANIGYPISKYDGNTANTRSYFITRATAVYKAIQTNLYATSSNYWAYRTSTTPLVSRKFGYISVNYNMPSEIATIYYNGSVQAATKVLNAGTGPTTFYNSATNDESGIANSSSDKYEKCTLDEIRMCKVQMPVGYFTITYNTICNCTIGGFFVLGSQEMNEEIVFGVPSPINHSINVPLTGSWCIQINDTTGNTFDYNISFNLTGKYISVVGASNGSKCLSYSLLPCGINVTVWVNVTSTRTGISNKSKFWFNTIACVYCPGQAYNWSNISVIWYIDLSSGNNSFSYNISCNNSQWKAGTWVHNGTYNITLWNLSRCNYTIWVNVSSGTCWSNDTYYLDLGICEEVENMEITIGVNLALFIVWLFMAYVMLKAEPKDSMFMVLFFIPFSLFAFSAGVFVAWVLILSVGLSCAAMYRYLRSKG
ncbi:MAG: DUF2341 domain-containing protein [Magnetococcus sp. YQC-3]